VQGLTKELSDTKKALDESNHKANDFEGQANHLNEQLKVKENIAAE